MTTGQTYAAEHWYGLAPWGWGWIVAAALVALAAAAWLAPRPAALERPSPLPDADDRLARRLFWGALAFGVLLHAPGLAGDFNMFDDTRQIHLDPTITTFSLENLGQLIWGYKGTNQELMYVSFALNWAVAGKTYWVWYLANLLGFAGILAMFHRFAWHMLGSRAGASVAVLLYASAPIVSELLCWISVRSHLIGMFFTLACVVSYLEASTRDGWKRFAWLGVSLAAFALTQLSKPIYLYIPIWLVMLDLWHQRQRWWHTVLAQIPFALVLAGFLHKMLGAGRHGHGTPLGGSYAMTLLTDLNLLVEYLFSLLVPFETGMIPHKNPATGWLAVDGIPMVLTQGFAPLASLIILLSVTLIALALAWRTRWRLPIWVLVAAFASFGTVLNVPWRGHAAAFEYRYTNSAHLLFAILLADVVLRLWSARFASSSVGKMGLFAAVVAYLTFAANESFDQTRAWSRSLSYWTRNADFYPLDYHANYYAGKATQHQKQYFAALEYLKVAEKNKLDKEVYRRLADCYYEAGLLDEARTNYLRYYSRKRQDWKKQEKRFAELGITEKMLRSAGRMPIEEDAWKILSEGKPIPTETKAPEAEEPDAADQGD